MSRRHAALIGIVLAFVGNVLFLIGMFANPRAFFGSILFHLALIGWCAYCIRKGKHA